MNNQNPSASEPAQDQQKNPPEKFTYSLYAKLVGVACMLLFGVCSLVSFLQMWGTGVDLFTAVVFPAFAFLGLLLFLWAGKRWTVSGDGIAVRSWYGREDTHYWIDLESVESTGLGSGIRIKDTFGKTVLSLDPWIARYGEFVEALRVRKPELFEQKTGALTAPTPRILKRNPIVYPIGILFSLLLIVPGIRGLLEGDWLGLLLALFGAVILYFMLRIPHSVHLLEDRLQFRYLLGERTVGVGDIYNIYARAAQDVQGGAGASVIVELMKGGKIELAGFREGAPLAANALRNWWEAYVKAHPPVEEEGASEEDGLDEDNEEGVPEDVAGD